MSMLRHLVEGRVREHVVVNERDARGDDGGGGADGGDGGRRPVGQQHFSLGAVQWNLLCRFCEERDGKARAGGRACRVARKRLKHHVKEGGTNCFFSKPIGASFLLLADVNKSDWSDWAMTDRQFVQSLASRFETLAMGSWPDGCVADIQRVLEMFHQVWSTRLFSIGHKTYI